MLQERIAELGSAILEIKGEKVHILGFMSPERLDDYIKTGSKCFYSQGIYDNRELNFGVIQDNALFIVRKDTKEVEKFQFTPLLKDTIKYKDENNKLRTKTYVVRKCNYTNLYNFIAREQINNKNGKKTSVEENVIFEDKIALTTYFENRFKEKLIL